MKTEDASGLRGEADVTLDLKLMLSRCKGYRNVSVHGN